jgi:outer membrane protein TolC
MVFNRSRKSQLVFLIIALIGLLALGVALGRPAGGTLAPADNEPQAAGSSERLRELMTERYEIHKRIAESIQKSFDVGRADLAEWRDAKVALYAAQADLSGDTANRIKVYEEMLDFLRKAEQLAQRRVDSGHGTEIEVSQTKLAMIEAQMSIEKLRLGQTR